MPLSGDQQARDDIGLDLLEEVELKSFTATPTAIGPFGASVLRWEVAGPSGVNVQLGQRAVAKSGEQVVQPTVSSIYRLNARVGQVSTRATTILNSFGRRCYCSPGDSPRKNWLQIDCHAPIDMIMTSR